MAKYGADDLRDMCRATFVAAGFVPDKADLIAQLMVEANLVGHDSHGVRHIPVYVISVLDDPRAGFERGAVGYLVKPVTKPQLDQAFATIERFMPGAERKLLIVGENKKALESMTDLLASEATKISTVKPSKNLIKTIESNAACAARVQVD